MPPTGLLTARSSTVRRARLLAKAKHRRRTGRFLAEGPQVVAEALADRRDPVRTVFCTPEAAGRHPELIAVADAAARLRMVDPDALRSISDTVASRGVVAVCDLVTAGVADVLAPGVRLVAAGVEVRDPGNAGTLIRCADAAGADGVLFAGDSVDVSNPKAVRASAGSLFHLPVAERVPPAEIVTLARAHGLAVLAADAAGEADLDDLIDAGELRRPTLWLFGNEAHGLAGDVAAAADHQVAIPIHGRAESLNLAAAAAICLYASARAQRR